MLPVQTRRHYTFTETLFWSQPYIIVPFLYASAVGAVYAATGWSWLKIPWTPLSLVGVAVAFFVGFKNNSSYDRLWEARRIWGSIVNTSRAWGACARDFVTDPSGGDARGIHRELVYRHIAWLAALRHALRAERSWEHAGPAEARIRATTRERQISLAAELQPLLPPGEIAEVTAQANVATQLIARQSAQLRALALSGHLDAYRHVHLQALLTACLDHQGASERVKNFPFPRQYASFTLYTVWLLAAALPFGLLDAFDDGSWGVVRMVLASTIVTWLFFTAEMIGDYSENPFEGLWNDIPITALSRTIEIDLRQMLGEGDVPPPERPTDAGLLL